MIPSPGGAGDHSFIDFGRESLNNHLRKVNCQEKLKIGKCPFGHRVLTGCRWEIEHDPAPLILREPLAIFGAGMEGCPNWLRNRS